MNLLISGGNYGKGKRTSMTDYFGSNSRSWKYDNRGRLVREDKIIDSATYTTQYTYDGADRINTITYPTNEVVTQTYNGRGLPDTLSGSVAGSLVTSVLYNQLGSLTDINLYNPILCTDE
jgi:YD repeat-containing protein